MPALPVIPNGFLVFQKIHSSVELHEMGCRICVVAPASGADPADVAQVVADSFRDTLFHVVSNSFSLGNTDVLPLDGIRSTTEYTTDAVGATGSSGAGGANLPECCAFGITLQTGVRGRSHRGRMYLPGVTGSQVVDERARSLTSTALSALSTHAGDFLTTLAGSVLQPLVLNVLSRRLGVATPVTNMRANPGLVLQRRRYERVARH